MLLPLQVKAIPGKSLYAVFAAADGSADWAFTEAS
jgi:hypothetical protein